MASDLHGECVDVEAIAKGLSKAQRKAIVGASDMMSNHAGYPFLTVEFTGEPWPEGVAQFLTIKSDRLTPLGLVVRKYLKDQPQ